jgi:acyl-CoA thioester hydrolase
VPFLFENRVRYVDTDASGRIHFTAMLRHFEAAEIEFMRSLALDRTYREQEMRGMQFPRVRVECNYTAFVRFDDLLLIEVSVERIGNTSYTLAFYVSVKETPVAQGRIVVVCVDMAENRSRPLPDGLRSALQNHQTGESAKVGG